MRGLHGEAMTKLVGCVAGEAYGAYLDARPDSASYGKVVTVELRPGTQVLVPAGVCNGFQSVSEQGTQYLYCFTEEWRPGHGRHRVQPAGRGPRHSAGRSRSMRTTRPRSRPRMPAAPQFSEQWVGS